MQRSNHAFSLVELSLVIVIIGVVTGGIVAGQGMLRSGRMVGAVSEIGRYKTAYGQFREQYKSAPGDFAGATALWGAVGGGGTGAACFNVSNTTTASCNGNGDGWVGLASGAISSDQWYRGEAFHAWKHLANAKLIEGRFTGLSGSASNQDVEPNINAPASSIKGYGYYLFYATAVGTRFARDASDEEWRGNILMMFNQTDANINSDIVKFIDEKMDDGLPGTGMVRSYTTCGTTTDKYTAKYLSNDANCRIEVYLSDGVNGISN